MKSNVENLSEENLKGTVDFAIITIREDEFEAVLQFFPVTRKVTGELRTYAISDFKTDDGFDYRAAILRSPEPGHSAAQAAASDVINDLNPNWLVLVGIAGGVPETEFSLGDVVIATRMIDFSVSAALAGGGKETAHRGSPAHKAVQDLASHLPILQLNKWNSPERLGVPLPNVLIDDEHIQNGEGAWRDKIRDTLVHRFQPFSGSEPRLPIVTAASIASGNILMKDPELLKDWLKNARDLKAVEMELPGVFEAARRITGDVPVLVIRGISDIVGFKRDPAWTGFACKTAASLARALLNTKPIPPRPKQMPVNVLAIGNVPTDMQPDGNHARVFFNEPKPTELAFAEVGFEDGLSPLIVTVYLISDVPQDLVDEINSWKQRIGRDSLVPEGVRNRIGKESLLALFSEPTVRAQLLGWLAVTNFSSYVYYGRRSEISRLNLTREELERRFIVEPLVHRLSKKSEIIIAAHSDHSKLSQSIEEAAKVVFDRFRRTTTKPIMHTSSNHKSFALLELARLVATASARYLSEPNNSDDSALFEHIRTRIRYAENPVTGEKHTRDNNPLT